MRKDGLARREEIIAAGVRCFVARGVHGTSLDDVRREAGASVSSVYNLFDGLSGVVIESAIRVFARLGAHVADRVAGLSSAREYLVALVDAHLEWIVGHVDEARFLYEVEDLRLPPRQRRKLELGRGAALTKAFAPIGAFVEEGALPLWWRAHFEAVVLGPTHAACRAFVAGEPLDPSWMRDVFPQLAWACVSTRLGEERFGP